MRNFIGISVYLSSEDTRVIPFRLGDPRDPTGSVVDPFRVPVTPTALLFIPSPAVDQYATEDYSFSPNSTTQTYTTVSSNRTHSYRVHRSKEATPDRSCRSTDPVQRETAKAISEEQYPVFLSR